jgi:UDP-glucose 4-epimerase
VRVRLWNVYGAPEEHSERSHVVADFVRQAIDTGEIRMLTTGDERRQFIYIDDVCRAFHQALAQGLQGLYDVTSFEWVSVRHVAEVIAQETGARVMAGSRAGSTPITPMQGKIPDWVPLVPLRDGLRRLIQQMRHATRETAIK